jgi:hypothetical protein
VDIPHVRLLSLQDVYENKASYKPLSKMFMKRKVVRGIEPFADLAIGPFKKPKQFAQNDVMIEQSERPRDIIPTTR